MFGRTYSVHAPHKGSSSCSGIRPFEHRVWTWRNALGQGQGKGQTTILSPLCLLFPAFLAFIHRRSQRVSDYWMVPESGAIMALHSAFVVESTPFPSSILLLCKRMQTSNSSLLHFVIKKKLEVKSD